MEKEITLDVVLTLGERLSSFGHTVRYTRSDDSYLSPSRRLEFIRKYKPDCFLSLHCNASGNPEANGVETIWRDQYDEELARSIQAALVQVTGLRDRGVKQDGTKEYFRNLAVLKDLKTPACLIEIGFLTNEEDRQVIRNIELVASAIEDGIVNWAWNGAGHSGDGHGGSDIAA
jgi:N-acetylmuramoyl-L-alanine amidase